MSFPTVRVLQIAQVLYEAQRAWLNSNGGKDTVSWDKASDTKKKEVFDTVLFQIDNPLSGDAGKHNIWMKAREADDWTWGKHYSEEKKTDPQLVLFHLTPPEYQAEHRLNIAIVKALVRV